MSCLTWFRSVWIYICNIFSALLFSTDVLYKFCHQPDPLQHHVFKIQKWLQEILLLLQLVRFWKIKQVFFKCWHTLTEKMYLHKWRVLFRVRGRRCSVVVMANGETHPNFPSAASFCKQTKKFCTPGTSSASVPTDYENRRSFNSTSNGSRRLRASRNTRWEMFISGSGLRSLKTDLYLQRILNSTQC